MTDERPQSTDPRRTHRLRHILTNAIGQEGMRVDTAMKRVRQGETLLLCSDGLWELIEDEELAEITRAAPDPQAACDTLVTLANERGGNDNISVIIVEF
ncbi:MAG: SpoIIE family protein phosphatase [Chloroflexota bacterium]